MATKEYTIFLIHGFVRESEENCSLSQIIPNIVTVLIIQFHGIPMVCIIDNGTGMIKAGFAKDIVPRCSFPNIYGQSNLLGIDRPYFGDELIANTNIDNVSWKYAMESGVVYHFDAMEEIWQHTFNNKLNLNTSGNYVVCTESPLNPKWNREKTVEIMFETFHVEGLCIAIDAVLALYASAKITGTVIQSGDGGTYTVPIYEGYCLRHAVGRLHIGGFDITNYLLHLLTEKGYMFTSFKDKMIVKDIKETDKLCYIAWNLDEELKKSKYSLGTVYDYELPDGQIISVDSERFRAPEILFKPYWIGFEDYGVQTYCVESIMKCCVDIRNILFENIVLNGGNTLFQGFGNRLKKEIIGLLPHSTKVKVIQPSNRKYSTWIGGAVLSELTSCNEQWIKKYEYEEYGPSIVHRKMCL